jgi:hypothetical protein
MKCKAITKGKPACGILHEVPSRPCINAAAADGYCGLHHPRVRLEKLLMAQRAFQEKAAALDAEIAEVRAQLPAT